MVRKQHCIKIESGIEKKRIQQGFNDHNFDQRSCCI